MDCTCRLSDAVFLMQDTAAANQLSALRKTLEETENRLQEVLSNEELARHDCLKQLEEAKAVGYDCNGF